MPKKLTTQEFIDRASFYHGNKYDYSKSVYISASKKIEIICPKHGPFIQNAGSHINPSIKAGCPYCARKKVFPGESDLLSQNPQIATLFDEEKNGIKANEIFAKTNKKYWWHCDFGYDHIYEMSPNAKITKKFKCPYCSGQKVLIGFNDLKTKFPDIASEWDYKKNKKAPSDYTYGSGYSAWWICTKCGMSYKSNINIHIRGHKCPYCSNQKILPGKNDLKTLFPKLAQEYSTNNVIPVNSIFPNSHKKVQWTCPNCNKDYWASPHHRVGSKTECPYCKKQSKGEREIERILLKYKINYKTQEYFTDLRGKNGAPFKFDFTLYEDDKWVGTIEFNGEQHYKPVSVFGGVKELENTKHRDMLKTKYCLEHQIPILIVQYKRSGATTEDMVTTFLRNLKLI